MLHRIRSTNDMGHALFDNIRAGDWLMDYLTSRLEGVAALSGVKTWMERCFDVVRSFPAGLKPQVWRPNTCVFVCTCALTCAAAWYRPLTVSFTPSTLPPSMLSFGVLPTAPVC